MNSFIRIAFSSTAFVLSISAHADGSIDFSQADAILKQQPATRAYLLDSLCFSDNGMANRLAGSYPMGGRRIGPYELYAKPKGQSGDYTLQVTVVTYRVFKNAKGKIVGPESATQLTETLESVKVSELKEPLPVTNPYNCK